MPRSSRPTAGVPRRLVEAARGVRRRKVRFSPILRTRRSDTALRLSSGEPTVTVSQKVIAKTLGGQQRHVSLSFPLSNRSFDRIGRCDVDVTDASIAHYETLISGLPPKNPSPT
jgi:hypothetical protein